MRLANFTPDQLKVLPLRAIVAFAARCARRVEPLAQLPEGNPQSESRREAVEAALRMAESFAGGINWRLPLRHPCGDDWDGEGETHGDVCRSEHWALGFHHARGVSKRRAERQRHTMCGSAGFLALFCANCFA